MRVEQIALGLGTVILPIGTELVREGIAELLLQAALSVQRLEGGLALGVPENAAVLLARAAHALDAVHGALVIPEPGQDEVHGLEPHGHGREHLALGLVGKHALVHMVLGAEVGVEVDLGL